MAAERPRCYVASPLGFTDDGSKVLNDVYLPRLRAVVTPVNPWDLTEEAEFERQKGSRRRQAFRLEIGRRNAEAIRESPLLAAYLEGQELDSGTASEIGYAYALGKRCYAIRSDRRQTGETEGRVNLQVEFFVTDSGGSIVRTLDELIGALKTAVRELGLAGELTTKATPVPRC